MTIERNRVASPQQQSSPRTVQTSDVEKTVFEAHDQALQLLNPYSNARQNQEVGYIVESIFQMGGEKDARSFEKILTRIMREARQSQFNTGDRIKDVFNLLKFREKNRRIYGWS